MYNLKKIFLNGDVICPTTHLPPTLGQSSQIENKHFRKYRLFMFLGFSGGNNAIIHVNDAAAKFNRGPDIFTFRTQILSPWVATISALPSACSSQKLQDSLACNESPTITHKLLPSSRQQLLFSKSPSMLYCSEVSPLPCNISPISSAVFLAKLAFRS